MATKDITTPRINPGNTSHGHARKGHRSPTYQSWWAMRNRCYRETNLDYKHYGGRGIKVCQRWLENFEHFLADMGEAPKGCTLDRIDVDGDYEPSNCRWANRKEQAINRNSTRWIEFNGQRKTMSEWAEALGLSFMGLHSRFRRGWPIEKALSPVRRVNQFG